MTKCLLTKLKGVADNAELLHIGELRFNVKKNSSPTAGSQYIVFSVIKDTEINIIGDGYISNSTFSENRGKNASLNANVNSGLYFINGDYKVAIMDKYSLKTLSMSNNGSFIANIDDLKYSKELSKLGGVFEGNISSIKELNKLTNISITGNNLAGDLSVVSGLVNTGSLSITGENLTGDLSAVSGLANMTGCYLKMSNLKGNLNSLANCAKLVDARFPACNITGDIATLPKTMTYLEFTGKLSWSERPSTSNIIAFGGRIQIDNVDKMLQDQAACVAYTGETPWFKKINVIGARTSASDAAVQKLQSKGYTVSITPA